MSNEKEVHLESAVALIIPEPEFKKGRVRWGIKGRRMFRLQETRHPFGIWAEP